MKAGRFDAGDGFPKGNEARRLVHDWAAEDSLDGQAAQTFACAPAVTAFHAPTAAPSRPMASSPEVVVVGSIMQDLTLTCAEFPRAGETVLGGLRTGQGGKGSNQAIACGRAGARTLFIGAMGRDATADQAENFYRAEKIRCHIARKAAHPTGTAVILLNHAGENEIVVAPGANLRLAAADVPAAALRGAKVVLTQLESNLATTAHALRTARRAQVTTILNPAPMRADFDPALLAIVDILIPNESEFAALVRQLSKSERPGFTEV